MGYLTSYTVKVEERLGVERIGYHDNYEGLVFRIVYENRHRRIWLETRKRTFEPSIILTQLRELGVIDAILLSPIYGEEWGSLQPLIAMHSRLTALDVQGYVRIGLDPVSSRGAIHIVHGSSDEIDGGFPVHYTVITDGPGEIWLEKWGRVYHKMMPRGGVLRDPTGAGDGFTAALLYHLLEGYPFEDAVEMASEAVYSLLPEVHREIWIEECNRIVKLV